MTNLRAGENLILSIAPNTKGFGYVVVEPPVRLLDWGVREVKGRSAVEIRRVLEAVYARYRAKTCLCRTPKRNTGKRARSRTIAQVFAKLAVRDQAIYRAVESGTIAAFFKQQGGAENKDDVARIVATLIPGLGHVVPGRRRTWASEHRRMGLFDAAAAVVWYTHTSGLQET